MIDTPPLRGLVCEDNQRAVRAVGVMLNRCGFSVAGTAGTASEAVREARRLDPDAIVLDLTLSGAMGLRIVSALIEAAPGVAVVVRTPFPNLAAPALELGAVGALGFDDLRPLHPYLMQIACRHTNDCDCGTHTAVGAWMRPHPQFPETRN